MPKKKPSIPHVHIQDMPARYFPRTRGNQSKELRTEVRRMLISIRYTNEKIQYTGQLCQFNLRSIPTKSGFAPSHPEVFRLMESFVYHYENYCYRVFAFREKLIMFINEILELEYEGHEINLKNVKRHPYVKDAHITALLEKFNKKQFLGKLIDERNQLTHKLYYGKNFDHYLRPTFIYQTPAEFKKWFSTWKGEVTSRSKRVENATHVITGMAHDVASRVIKYKDSI